MTKYKREAYTIADFYESYCEYTKDNPLVIHANWEF